MAKTSLIILILIISVAAFFRFYQLDGYMTFLGDEGRDMMIIKDLVREGNVPFIGPASSVGNVYLGPLYYYMMGLTALVFGLNPVFQAGMVAVLGVASVFLVYYLGRIFFNEWSGLLSAWLYAISPVTIIYSKSSWNPNPAPFFTLLSVWAFYRWSQSLSWRWSILVGIFVSAAVQMHYLTLPLIPVYTILTGWCWYQKKISKTKFVKSLVFFFTSFNILLLPWWLFEFKHNFLNLRGIADIFFGSSSSVGGLSVNIFVKVFNTIINILIGNYLTGGVMILSFGVLALVGWIMVKQKNNWNSILISTLILVGLGFVNLYKGDVYDHYVGYLAPGLFILMGSSWMLLKRWGRWGLLGLVAILTIFNLQGNPLKYPANNQLKRTQEISKYVIEQADGKPFNFALIAKNNYDSAYQFYLEEYGYTPKIVPKEKTDQLFIVCEDLECNPINHPKYEIAAFGMSKIESKTEFAGVKVFKLVANPSGKPT